MLMENEDLEKILQIVTGPLGDQIDAIHAERLECASRGYHRVSNNAPKTDKNELMICYDCELWFGSKDNFVTYRVEPL